MNYFCLNLIIANQFTFVFLILISGKSSSFVKKKVVIKKRIKKFCVIILFICHIIRKQNWICEFEVNKQVHLFTSWTCKSESRLMVVPAFNQLVEHMEDSYNASVQITRPDFIFFVKFKSYQLQMKSMGWCNMQIKLGADTGWYVISNLARNKTYM